MRDLKHVNCIAPKQTLPFEATGMTVVYGGNGSGKSGYARVMKRACRARDQKEQVLPDANDPAAHGCIPEAFFDIKVNGTAKTVQWSSTGDPPEELATVAVFDCHCARVYLTNEQEIAYLPYGLDILEALANTVLPELERRLNQEIAGINIDSRPFDLLQGDTEVGRLIANLSHNTAPEVLRDLAKLSDEDLKRSEELDRTLGEADPAAQAKQLRLSAERLKELAQQVDASMACIDDKATGTLKSIAQECAAANLTEQAAIQVLRSGEVLLPGTGDPVWKALFEAARKFSTERAYPERKFPNTEDAAVCVLCQQPLRDAGERLERFEKYIQDNVAKVAATTRQRLAKEVESVTQAKLVVGANGAIGDELDQLDATVRPMISAFEEAVEERRRHLLAAIPSLSWAAVPAIIATPRRKLRDLAAKQYRHARNYGRAANAAQNQILRKEREALAVRKELSSCIEKVLALLSGLKNKNALDVCRKDLSTRPISIKSGELASAAVTSALKDALDTEFTTLGIGHIKTKLKDRTVKGRIMHQLLLDVPTSSKVEDILSEGEQRTIALGSFLAELRPANHSAAIVFDDPVSSLDHKRREKVAARLSSESLRRQVIVFTHDIVFLNQLRTECSHLGLIPGLCFLEKIGRHAGAISKGLPWDHKSYKDRIDSLEKAQKEFEKLPWPVEPHEELARKMIQQYSFFRATIERVVQDFVLNCTVKRFEEYIRVEHLKKVVGLEEAEVAEICRLYNRCHDIVEAHDRASAIDGLPPTAGEFGADIEALKAVIQTIKDRRGT